MSLIAPVEPHDQNTAHLARHGTGRRWSSNDELLLRDLVDAWARQRWPQARQVHELVMDRGRVRADMVIVDQAHFVAVEIKSVNDYSERLLHQCAMFRLASPELWICCDAKHSDDAALVRYLMPSIGLLRRVGPPNGVAPQQNRLEVVAEAAPFRPDPRSMLNLLWVAELTQEARMRGLLQGGGKPLAHAALVNRLLALPETEQRAAVCRQLRARDAMWRADPPIKVVA